MYGTTQTIKETFNKAVQYNEPLTVYLEMAKIYAATNKMEVSRGAHTTALTPCLFSCCVPDGQ